MVGLGSSTMTHLHHRLEASLNLVTKPPARSSSDTNRLRKLSSFDVSIEGGGISACGAISVDPG